MLHPLQTSSNSPKPPTGSESRWLELALGAAALPLMVGLVAARSAGQWLQNWNLGEQSWWSEQRLPPLDPQQLQARQERLQSSAESETSEGEISPCPPEESSATLDDGSC